MRFVLPVALAIVAGCTQSDAQSQRGQRGPTQVGFVVVQRTSVPVQSLLGGRTVAFEISEVRPQVNGVIRRRYFTEGSYVRQGQPLYQIDPSLYRAAVNQAQANVASARATPRRRRSAPTLQPLAEMEAVSKQDYTDAAAGASGRGRRRPEQGRARNRADQPALHHACPRRSAGGSAVRCRPWARWSPPTRPIRWPSSSALDPIYVDIQQSSADL